MDAVEEIEEALVLHRSNFGRVPGGAMRERGADLSSSGCVWISKRWPRKSSRPGEWKSPRSSTTPR